MIKAAVVAACLVAAPVFASTDCDRGEFEGVPFTSCIVDPAQADVRLFWRDREERLIGSFSSLADQLAGEGNRLVLAMNGAMYHADRRPVGLYIESGQTLSDIVLRDGPGNFGLLPNGVLCLSDGAARVVESRAFAEAGSTCDYAVQSGPLLVEDGELHPRFLPAGTSEHIRNGVGVRQDGRLVLAISDAPLNFHRFGRLFRDNLGTPNALYIDGRVSRLFAPEVGRADIGLPMGPILGVVEPND